MSPQAQTHLPVNGTGLQVPEPTGSSTGHQTVSIVGVGIVLISPETLFAARETRRLHLARSLTARSYITGRPWRRR
jgi:hypothetical protein